MSDELLLSILAKNLVYSSGKITQVKTLSNVVQETPDNIAQEKNLFNVVLILLAQHCTGKKLVFNVVLILLGQHCTGKILV